MLRDVIGRLSAFAPLDTYTYVGFGAPWFSDFSLFHRFFGLKQMKCIEKSAGYRARFEFNAPFRIDMDFRESSAALVDLDWRYRNIIWLDYDDPLLPSMLSDIRTITSSARSGTLLAVSFQCQAAKEVTEAETDADTSGRSAGQRFLDRFNDDVDEDIIHDDDLVGWPFAKLGSQIISNAADSGCADRADNMISQHVFQTIASFQYQDDAKMCTVVGVLFTEEERPSYVKADFQSLDFLNSVPSDVRIELPNITPREVKFLESQLPAKGEDAFDYGVIPSSDAKKFISLYRYLPNFAVLEN